MAETGDYRLSCLRAYAQLVRLPNIFTAIADVMMGYLVTRGSVETQTFSLLVGTTVALYWAGMVLNDVCDVETDRRERPHRPIPSGRVPLGTARMISRSLLIAGVALAAVAGLTAGSLRPPLLAVLLAGTVVTYDALVKETSFGPLVMGTCRALNVLLGMSLAVEISDGRLREWHSFEWLVAAGLGVYVAGVTWFSRGESDESSRAKLSGALAVMVAGLAMLGSLPLWTDIPIATTVRPTGWYLFWILITLVIARRCVLAIMRPSPDRVQTAVKNAILSLIVIDAGITLAVCGVFWGCAVLLLLAPAIVLGRWIYST
jgi:4-hydroxybenzoate polyprenyltransferase